MTNTVNTTNATINALTKLTMVQLKDLAKSKGLKGYSSLKKEALIKLITSLETEQDPVETVDVEPTEVDETENLEDIPLNELCEMHGADIFNELVRRADLLENKDHSRWSRNYLVNLLKGAEARTARRKEFKSSFSKDENGWYVAERDGNKYAFNESKVLIKVGDNPAKMKEVSSLQEGFDACWDTCRKLFGDAHKKGGKN